MIYFTVVIKKKKKKKKTHVYAFVFFETDLKSLRERNKHDQMMKSRNC